MTIGTDTPGRCAIDACGKTIQPDRLMCRRHWKMVPLSLQRILWRAYDNAKRSGGVLGDSAYGRARDDCIRAVERQLPAKPKPPSTDQGALGL